jgi:hypothetical protein
MAGGRCQLALTWVLACCGVSMGEADKEMKSTVSTTTQITEACA